MAVKHGVFLADTHTGAYPGLTPPAWQFPIRGGTTRRNAWGKSQSEAWGQYLKDRDVVGPVDFLVHAGDIIEGTGRKSGGTELITPDLQEQQAMAVEIFKAWEAKKIIACYGTSYHVSPEGQDMERGILREVGGEIHSHPFLSVEGVTFDVKHHLGASAVPYGQGTPIARERLWNVLWAEKEEQPKSQVVIRAHTHSFSYVGNGAWLAMSLPALEIAGTKYGGRRCAKTVDWGLVEFWCEGGEFRWEAHCAKLEANRTVAIAV